MWSKKQKSNLILSLIRGIPIPPIYLFEDKDDHHEIIDGLQRITTIINFLDGDFNIISDSKDYNNISCNDIKIGNKIIAVFLVKQKTPADLQEGKFAIFEILNQTACPLNTQEIRNSTHRGSFNDFIKELNRDLSWRQIYNTDIEKARFLDCEFILRCCVAVFYLDRFNNTMFLSINAMMQEYNKKCPHQDEIKRCFLEACKVITKHGLDIKIVRLKLIKAESVIATIMQAIHLNRPIPDNLNERHKKLLKDDEFKKNTNGGTSGKSSLQKRMEIATKILID